jgi:hypothetical protein
VGGARHGAGALVVLVLLLLVIIPAALVPAEAPAPPLLLLLLVVVVAAASRPPPRRLAVLAHEDGTTAKLRILELAYRARDLVGLLVHHYAAPLGSAVGRFQNVSLMDGIFRTVVGAAG